MISKKKIADVLRVLAMDAVDRAKSGHVGVAMGMATVAEVLWRGYLKHSPLNPKWWDRDRFVLSNGHGSMLLYALLHLTGYSLSMEDIRQFRQLHSKAPGHPEVGETPGVETTTGPLAQGLANAVGMALAERHLAHIYNTHDITLFDHYTYVFLGDGCLMEGLSHEVCSFAGTQALGKLIAFWDDNGISIDGEVSGWFTDNTPERFRSYGWQVIEAVDAYDRDAIEEAIRSARRNTHQPTLICCKTVIGYGSPNKAGTAEAHGCLGAEETQLARENLSYELPAFEVSEDMYRSWDARWPGQSREQDWYEEWQAYQARYPEKAKALELCMNHEFPAGWSETLYTQAQSITKPMATRKASQLCLDWFAEKIPALIGGSADLTSSNGTQWVGAKPLTAEQPTGRYLHYGVREFGMAGIMNGMALHGGIIPFGGTFLTFSDYARPAIRLSALMRQKVIYVLTHDSIGVGEDGPTHQPIEHTASLRAIPHLQVWRPCDLLETAVAWQSALEYQGPTALLLTRQDLPAQLHADLELIRRGGYILHEPNDVEAIIIATGSEVDLAMRVAKKMTGVRVVSMPCVDLFLSQPADYQETVLPASIRRRVAIEAGAPDTWYRFVGLEGKVVGLTCFGLSAPYQQVFDALGITEESLMRALEGI